MSRGGTHLSSKRMRASPPFNSQVVSFEGMWQRLQHRSGTRISNLIRPRAELGAHWSESRCESMACSRGGCGRWVQVVEERKVEGAPMGAGRLLLTYAGPFCDAPRPQLPHRASFLHPPIRSTGNNVIELSSHNEGLKHI